MTVPAEAITAAWLDRAREMADDPDPRMARRGTEILEGDL